MKHTWRYVLNRLYRIHLINIYLRTKQMNICLIFIVVISNSDSFNANINMGIRRICQDMGMSKEEYYCFYTFRHTWATIAQNDCGATKH